MKIIVAFTNKSFGIGYDNKLPWNIPEDLRRFSEISKGNTVVMGRNTWASIGKTPLKDRFNIVISSEHKEEQTGNGLVFINGTTLENLPSVINHGEIFIIGGEELYRRYVGEADTIYATVIEKDYECDRFFPTERLHEYDIEAVSQRHFSATEECFFRYITYRKRENGKIHGEWKYTHMLNEILYNGEARPDRTGVGTLSTFGHQLRFDISKSVPFLTTKQLAWRTVIKELLWFLSGSTDAKVLEAQGVGIWNANTSREFLDNRGLNYREGDMGPLYSHALRFYGSQYHGCDANYSGKGFDQIENLLHGLKTDPYSRRHVITTFNPAVVDQCVLMPGHGIAVQFYVSGDESKKKLSCHAYCRSSDTFLGLPFNIASYAVMTYVFAKLCGMTPYELIVSTGDTHIYANHVDQVKAQLSRNPLPFPKLVVSDNILDKPIEQITIDDFVLEGYVSYGPIKAPMAV